MNILYLKKRFAIFLAAAFLISAAGFPFYADASEITHEDINFTVDSALVDRINTDSFSGNYMRPYAFLTKKKIVLNGMRASVSDDTCIVMNTDGDYEVNGITSANGISIYINRISLNGLPAFRIGIEAGSKTSKGTYKYDIGVRDRKSGSESNRLKLSVTVKKTNPAVKWKQQSVVLGTGGNDFAVNSPTVEGVSIMPLNSTQYKVKIPEGIIIRLQNENTIKITADAGRLKLNKYYPVQLYMMYTDSENMKVVKKSFKVKVTDETPSVTLKKAGGFMDLSSRDEKSVHYRVAVKNSGMVVKDIWIEGAASGNYVMDKEYDPATGEISDIFIRAGNDAPLSKGSTTLNFRSVLQDAGMDTREKAAGMSVRTSVKSSALRMAFISGNQLKFNETLSDNLIAGTTEIRVNSPLYAKIDTDSILDLTYDKGDIPKDAFKSYWTVDEYGQAARIRVVADKSKVVSGKKYNLTYSLKAKGADKNTAPTKITVKVKL